jgi:hypothetical protein
MIRAGRVQEWLEAEERKWACKECGKPISMHSKECH